MWFFRRNGLRQCGSFDEMAIDDVALDEVSRILLGMWARRVYKGRASDVVLMTWLFLDIYVPFIYCGRPWPVAYITFM